MKTHLRLPFQWKHATRWLDEAEKVTRRAPPYISRRLELCSSILYHLNELHQRGHLYGNYLCLKWLETLAELREKPNVVLSVYTDFIHFKLSTAVTGAHRVDSSPAFRTPMGFKSSCHVNKCKFMLRNQLNHLVKDRVKCTFSKKEKPTPQMTLRMKRMLYCI